MSELRGQDAVESPKMRITCGWLLRITASIAILGALFWFVPIADLRTGFSNVSPAVFILCVALFMVGHLFAGLKWWLLIGGGFSYLKAARAHFAGLAANLCLPGVAGGDVVRAGLVSGDVEVSQLTAGSLSDRLIDMLALALVALSGLVLLQSGAHDGSLVIKIGALFLVALIGAFYALPVIAPIIVRAVPKLPAGKFILKTAVEFGKLGKRPQLLISTLGLSVLIQAGFVSLFVMLANSAGASAPDGAWFFGWSIAKILAVLPISLGGIGVREATLAGLMSPWSDPAPVVVASLIWQAVLIVTGLIGAAIWLLKSDLRKSKEA